MARLKFLGASIVLTGLVLIPLVFIVMLFLVKVMWAWTIPDLFPGAVQQGLVAPSIGWLTSAKIAIFIAILSAFAGGRK